MTRAMVGLAARSLEALRALAARSGELPDNEWWLGWHDGTAGEGR